MTNQSEAWRQDLDNYKKLALKAALGLFIILFICVLITQNSLTIGLLIGSSLANINVFVLGRALYDFLIRKIGGLALGGPLLSFLILSGVGLLLTLFYPGFCLGFALGLTSPLVLGALIAYKAARSV